MLTKLKKNLHTDNFAYFIRYFGVFTLIFGLMTLIILQLMRGTVYQSSDVNFKEFQNDPKLLLDFALARGISSDSEIILEQKGEKDSEDKEESSKPKPPFEASNKLRLNTNYHVILYDHDGTILNTQDSLSGLSDLELDTKHLNEIYEKSVTTAFGEEETYRVMTVQISTENTVLSSLKENCYATILFNTTQLKSSLVSYETTVILVMVSFWLISIVTSIYLARVSVRPILQSFQKQKEFVENASHELRTPLAVLQNRLESLFRHPEATILDSSESIASSLAEVRNMRLLTTNLLNLARRDDGLKADIGLVQPSFFDDMLLNYQLIAEENGKQLEIENQVKESIRTDRTLFKQLLTILFDNAMKYSDKTGKIAISIYTKDKYLIVKVADNGIGIRPEDKERIFDRFYRVDKARTRQKGGFGLGLSLAKQILDALKGTITVYDNQPKGSVFEVKLPK